MTSGEVATSLRQEIGAQWEGNLFSLLESAAEFGAVAVDVDVAEGEDLGADDCGDWVGEEVWTWWGAAGLCVAHCEDDLRGVLCCCCGESGGSHGGGRRHQDVSYGGEIRD